jgi:hypothetical protein
MDEHIAKPISGARIAEVLKAMLSKQAEGASPAESASEGAAKTPETSATTAISAQAEETAAEHSSPDVIDLPDLLHRCMGKPTIAGRVLGRFQESVPQLLVQLEESLNSSDLEKARQHAHTLKGAAANVSASVGISGSSSGNGGVCSTTVGLSLGASCAFCALA